jgi:tetratricopeptide (TPR) repeat protein
MTGVQPVVFLITVRLWQERGWWTYVLDPRGGYEDRSILCFQHSPLNRYTDLTVLDQLLRIRRPVKIGMVDHLDQNDLNGWEKNVDWDRIEDIYTAGMQAESIADLSADEASSFIGGLIDAAGLLEKQDGLKHALSLIEEALEESFKPALEAELHYFEGNAHAALRELVEEKSSSRDLWHQGWDAPALEPVILSYRRAANHPAFSELPLQRRCQIWTNLGNTLSAIGRSIEAIESYDHALELDPAFHMARGNRAFASGYYAAMFFDKGQAAVFHRFNYADLATAADSDGYVEPEAQSRFEQYREQLGPVLGDTGARGALPDLYNHSLGSTHEEHAYRKWCLQHRLFLNPMNDLGAYPIAAHDVLHTPPIVTDLETGPKYHGAFNQLKQGFVSARYLFYEGVTATEPHFSDRDVLLYNTLDYPAYSLAVEKIKLAYRSFYSLFDQIGFLLNDYFDLGIDHRYVYFRRLWYQAGHEDQGLREDITSRENRPLMALFWLSKDLHENRDEFWAAMAPEARRLSKIRHHLEHRYLKVHDMLLDEPVSDITRSVRYDDLAESISRDDFERKTIKLAKRARAALIYLSLAMHVENVMERRKKLDGLAMPRTLDVIEDDWKR